MNLKETLQLTMWMIIMILLIILNVFLLHLLIGKMYHSTFLASVLLAIACAGALTSASGAVVYPMITHVLDVSKGRPGNGIRTQFYRQDENGWTRFQDSFTNSNGRLNDLIPRQNFTSGIADFHIS